MVGLVGAFVGILEGARVGNFEGAWLGTLVGRKDGSADGRFVGISNGAGVGVVGLAVGNGTGEGFSRCVPTYNDHKSAIKQKR